MINNKLLESFLRRANSIEADITQLRQMIQSISESDNIEEVEYLRKENQRLRENIRQLELELWMTKHK